MCVCRRGRGSRTLGGVEGIELSRRCLTARAGVAVSPKSTNSSQLAGGPVQIKRLGLLMGGSATKLLCVVNAILPTFGTCTPIQI